MAHKYIGLQGIIDLLGGEKKRGTKGEHICICPVHGDHKPSLSVREGDKGIVMTCTSRGCTTEQVCEALGIRMSELFKDPPPSTRTGRGRPAAAKPPARAAGDDKPSKTYNSYGEAYGWLGKLVRTYPYTDSKGALQFEVARIQGKDGEKTFRQHRPVTPDGSDSCAFPIRLDVPAQLRDNLIYRQPELEAAVAAGQTVYIVEGEKDADTMWRLGLAATTNAGGGTKDKWKDGHTAHFRDAAEVVILPDNDTTGEGHGEEVYRAVARVAKAAYVVKLSDGYPDLMPKGDFTDLVEAVGDEKALEILDKLVAEARESLWQRAQRAYMAIEGYGIVNGNTCQILEDGTARRLCNFVALPVRELTTDDGAIVDKQLEIVGWKQNGERFPKIRVPFEQYKNLDWAFNNWGVAANIMPGTAIREKLRYAIQGVGAMVAKFETNYTHFGWQKIDGKWCYLHQDGCIGAEGVQAEHNDRLKNYGLGEWPDDMDMVDAAYQSYNLSELIQEYCSVPMLGITYLAPLCSFLEDRKCDYPPAFATILCAGHGSGKSTIAALFMCHFGHFTYQSLPANFENTGNSIRLQAYVAKDSLFCIDDYHPGQSIQEQRRINDLAQMLARTFGDHADRARMDKNMKLQKSMPPRCLAVVTGEEPPKVGQSGLARYYTIRVDDKTFPRTEEGYSMLRLAREGALRMAMTGYIQWLAEQADELPEMLREMFEVYKPKAHELIAGAATNDRADAAAAHIMIGLTMMTRWMISLGLMDEDMAKSDIEKWWGVIIGNIKEQGRVSKTETPTSMYMDALRSLIDSGAVVVDDLRNPEAKSSNKLLVGWMDDDNYYFDQTTVYAQVKVFYRNQDTVFPVSVDTLNKMLENEGIIEQTDKRGKRTSKQKNIRGKNRRCLWIPRWRIDGGNRPAPMGEQMRMEGFTEVDDADLPWTGKEDESESNE